MTNGTPHFSVWFACMPGKIEINANGTRLRDVEKTVSEVKHASEYPAHEVVSRFRRRVLMYVACDAES